MINNNYVLLLISRNRENMHSKSLFISLICLLLWTVPSFSQTKLIKGQVIIHDSKSENGKVQFLPNTKITSITSGHVYSDQKGRFKLKVKDVDVNEPLFLQVEKQGYEIINLRDIKYFFLDKKPWLKIFVAEKGYTKRVRNAIAVTAKESLTKEREELLESITTNKHLVIPTFENRFGRKINSVYEADELLSKLSNQIEEEIRYTAYELVVVNPDGASDIYMNAMTYYRQGDLGMAIKTLQKEKVETLVDEIILDVEKSGKNQLQINRLLESRANEIEQIKNNYIFQTIALQQSFRIREAALILKKLEQINEVAFSRKHDEIIERLDFFKIDESFNINENILLSETSHSSEFPNTSSPNTPQVQSSKDNSLTPYQQKKTVSNSTFEIPTSNNIVTKKSIESNVIALEDSFNNKKAANFYTKKKTVKSQTIPFDNDLENQAPPNISHSVVNNGSTITITTTVTTNGNGNIHVSSDINDAGNVLTEIDSKSNPLNYDYLTAKGAVETSVQVKESDFESIIFPIENTSDEFKSFLKKEKKEEQKKETTPKKWEKSNKYR